MSKHAEKAMTGQHLKHCPLMSLFITSKLFCWLKLS